MTEEELQEAGLNRSDVHVDFAIGSNQMDIELVSAKMVVCTNLRNGDWVI